MIDTGRLGETLLTPLDQFDWRTLNDENRPTIDFYYDFLLAYLGMEDVDAVVMEMAGQVRDILWQHVDMMAEVGDLIREAGRMSGATSGNLDSSDSVAVEPTSNIANFALRS